MGNTPNGRHGRMIDNKGILEIDNDRLRILRDGEHVDEMPRRSEKDASPYVNIFDNDYFLVARIVGLFFARFVVMHVPLTFHQHGLDDNVRIDMGTTIPRVDQRTEHNSGSNGHGEVEEDSNQRHQHNDTAIAQSPVPQNIERLPLESRQYHHEQNSSQCAHRKQFNKATQRHHKEQHENTTHGRTDTMPRSIHNVNGTLSDHCISPHGTEHSRDQVCQSLRKQFLIGVGHFGNRVGNFITRLESEDGFHTTNGSEGDGIRNNNLNGIRIGRNRRPTEDGGGTTHGRRFIHGTCRNTKHHSKERVFEQRPDQQSHKRRGHDPSNLGNERKEFHYGHTHEHMHQTQN
mmetsp:Transcript_23819/g.50530  ORF Transcript_23819/g.50530 Transcript_23819/m.50530 type:complete len:346 (-) Transcript_23819:38-1075(-)